MNRKFSLIVLLATIGLTIWFLESRKVTPSYTGVQAGGEAINLDSATLSQENVGIKATSTESQLISEALSAIARKDKEKGFEPASEIVGPTGFINTDSNFRLKNLIGKKVILLDFWTYSCINCIRTLPYLTSWYEKYKDQGFVIVGIHTPEFEFEKDINNVKTATTKYGINYPVILDSDYGTWGTYGNQYWPHHYLIDIAGYVVHDHIGEGAYEDTEKRIQALLEERAVALGESMPNKDGLVDVKPANLSGIGSPETYFGSLRNRNLGNGESGLTGSQSFVLPSRISSNLLFLKGDWNVQPEFATNVGAYSEIIFKYNSKNVYFVGSAPSNTTVTIYQDDVLVSGSGGADVKDGKVIIKDSRLYHLISNPDGPGEHTLRMIIETPGLEAFTFTFG